MAVPDQFIRPGGGVRGACPEDSRVCGGGAGRHHEAPPQHDVSTDLRSDNAFIEQHLGFSL